MALDFPVHPRLKEPEEKAVRELIKQEPLLSRTTLVTGLILLAIQTITDQPNAFQRLLDLLRVRMQAEGGAA